MRAILALFSIFFFSGILHAENLQPEPASKPNAIAIVLGKEVTAEKANKLNRLIFGPLFLQFAKENQIQATEEEITAFNKKTDALRLQSQIQMIKDRDRLAEELKSSKLSQEERAPRQSQFEMLDNILKRDQEFQKEAAAEQLVPMQRQIAQRFIKTWKINQALYKKYGGRIIFQQAGPEPIDAYRDFLKEEEKKGSFQIIDKKYESNFWKYYIDDSMHVFAEQAEGKKMMDTPFWEMPLEEEPLTR